MVEEYRIVDKGEYFIVYISPKRKNIIKEGLCVSLPENYNASPCEDYIKKFQDDKKCNRMWCIEFLHNHLYLKRFLKFPARIGEYYLVSMPYLSYVKYHSPRKKCTIAVHTSGRPSTIHYKNHTLTIHQAPSELVFGSPSYKHRIVEYVDEILRFLDDLPAKVKFASGKLQIEDYGNIPHRFERDTFTFPYALVPTGLASVSVPLSKTREFFEALIKREDIENVDGVQASYYFRFPVPLFISQVQSERRFRITFRDGNSKAAKIVYNNKDLTYTVRIGKKRYTEEEFAKYVMKKEAKGGIDAWL